MATTRIHIHGQTLDISRHPTNHRLHYVRWVAGTHHDLFGFDFAAPTTDPLTTAQLAREIQEFLDDARPHWRTDD